MIQIGDRVIYNVQEYYVRWIDCNKVFLIAENASMDDEVEAPIEKVYLI